MEKTVEKTRPACGVSAYPTGREFSRGARELGM